MFANQNGENFGAFASERLKFMAQELDLDTEAFDACYDGRDFRSKVQDVTAEGRARGIAGTPSIFINGESVTTPGSFAQLQQLVQAALGDSQ